MAITWGPTLNYGTNNQTRLGIDIWVSGDPASGSVRVWAAFYIWTKHSIADNQVLNYSGAFSGSHGFYNDGGQFEIRRDYITRSTVYGQTRSVTIGGQISEHWAGVQPSHSRTITVPARPISAPSAFTAATGSCVSDSQANLAWTIDAPASRPITDFVVRRYSNVLPNGTDVRTLGGGARSWQDSGLEPDRRYQWTFIARNAAGSSSGTTPALYTTPARPGRPVATRDGTTAHVTVQGTSTIATSAVWQYRVGGGAATNISGGDLNGLTHASAPTGGALEYRTAAVAGGLQSAWSEWSLPLQMLAAPYAPTDTTPSTVDAAVAGGLPISWVHNAADGSPQTAYSIRHRTVGGSWTTIAKTTSTASERVIAGIGNGTDREIQISTWGSHADQSDWSPVRTIRTHARPTATITSPATSLSVASMLVGWTYSNAQPQAGWRVTILKGAVQVGQWQGVSADLREHAPPVVLDNGGTYTVRVEVQNAYGQWSAPVTRTTTVTYAAPPTPTVTATWDPDEGSVDVAITTPPAETGQPAATGLYVQRSVDGGEWETIATGLPLTTTVTDPIPPLKATINYRAVTTSAIDTTAASTPATVGTDVTHGWIWLNGGPGWATVARLRAAPSIAWEPGWVTEEVELDGRDYPVIFDARQRADAGTISASLLRGASTAGEIAAVCDLISPVLIRAPIGETWWASLGRPRFSASPGVTTVQIPWRRAAVPAGVPA